MNKYIFTETNFISKNTSWNETFGASKAKERATCQVATGPAEFRIKRQQNRYGSFAK